PVFIFIPIAIKLTSKGPVFYRQKRVGLREGVFNLIKFRSMIQDAEAGIGAVWSQKNDPRVTPIGRFMRRTRIDEIPQFLNVLSGDMSIIGPRPERPEFVKELEKEIPYYSLRHTVKPGLTGWAQINYRYGASEEDAVEKLHYDLYYIQEASLLLDIVIVLKTISTLILKRGS
ncbi:MAG: sugar transferase, partial [Planctomycetota bacterium]